MITLTTLEDIIFTLIDAHIAFHTNISNQKNRYYICLSISNVEWIRTHWPDHQQLKYTTKELVSEKISVEHAIYTRYRM